MQSPKRVESPRPPWIAIGVLVGLAIGYQVYRHRVARRDIPPEHGTVSRLAAHRTGPDAYGRRGDLVLGDPGGGTLTVSSMPDEPGHRPLLGAVVDLAATRVDVTDPLIWYRVLVVDGAQPVELPYRAPQAFTCEGGWPGVRSTGGLGFGLFDDICALGDGRFRRTTSAKSLPETAFLGDEINVGSATPVVAVDGGAWDTEHDTPFLAFAGDGTAILLEAPRMHVSRTFSRFGKEIFPSPIIVRYGPGPAITRVIRVTRGDVLDALSLVDGASRTLEVDFGAGSGGSIAVFDDAGRELASGTAVAGKVRTVKLPPGFGTYAVLRNDGGVITDARVPLPASGARVAVKASAAVSARVELAYADEAGAGVPVHVLVKGLEGTPDPTLLGAEPGAVYAGRSVYLLAGKGVLALPPGKFRLTASHGLAHSIAVNEIAVSAGEATRVTGVVREALRTEGWLAADFHLHSAPSPDSKVTLLERVQSLACEGIDLAVATDHNRITDLSRAAVALGVDGRLATVPGVEISSVGVLWGHFNAFPLPLPTGAPEDATPVYYAKRPAEMFSDARSLGARVIQVNHARMNASIGYFDQAKLDARTGHADPILAEDFDALEAYNGMWIETRERIREGPLDLVALARRGKRVAATGNSDSHHLLFEEAGFPRTWVRAPREPRATRVDRALQVLLAGDTTVSSGPFVELAVEGRPPGSTVTPAANGRVRVHVRVSAPSWVPVDTVEIWRDDVVVHLIRVPGPPVDGVRLESDVEVDTAGRDATVLAWAEGDSPLPDVVPYDRPLAIGFTSLVYVDGDRDGSVRVPEGAPGAPPPGAAPSTVPPP